MNKSILFFFLFITLMSVPAEEQIKKGFGFGALPAISYDSDLGFQYGALVNLYLYGDGSHFPKYDHSIYMELSTYTKGTTIARFRYDSELLHCPHFTFYRLSRSDPRGRNPRRYLEAVCNRLEL